MSGGRKCQEESKLVFLFVCLDFFFFPFAKYVSRADIGLKRRGTLSWNDRTRGGDGFKQKEGSS